MSVDLILSEMRRWDARRASDRSVDEAVRRHITGAIRPFLGDGAVSRILPPAADSSRLLAAAENGLATFLGAKAAYALVNRAMDRVTMRS
ncbi:MAG: hypothetical protein JST11_01485 [Acidobacteria bacterium]|nr:hypothetical protein [Acidobacteriota bacterium]